MSAIESRLKKTIREVKDFPIKGIGFKDITPILKDPYLCNAIVEEFYKQLAGIKIDAILGIESRGFLLGIPMAQKFRVPFIPIRKEGKLPGETISYSYDLEYGSATVEMHKDDLNKGEKVLIHDDLLATGGTAVAAGELVKMQGAEVAAFSFICSLDFLNGEERLKNFSKNTLSLARYKD